MRDYTKLFDNDLFVMASKGDKLAITELKSRMNRLEDEIKEHKSYNQLLAQYAENAVYDGYWDDCFIPDAESLDDLLQAVMDENGLKFPIEDEEDEEDDEEDAGGIRPLVFNLVMDDKLTLETAHILLNELDK